VHALRSCMQWLAEDLPAFDIGGYVVGGARTRISCIRSISIVFIYIVCRSGSNRLVIGQVGWCLVRRSFFHRFATSIHSQ
jgi:hypothetical protein